MNDTDSEIRDLFKVLLRDEPAPLSATDLQDHGDAIAIVSTDRDARPGYGRWAVVGLAAASLVAVLVAANTRPTANPAASPAETLTAANEVPLTFESVDIQTAGPHWDTKFHVADARPFYVGTGGLPPTEPLDRCVGRGEGAFTAGCGAEGPAVTHLVVESSGVIDTIVWDGLPANTSYVILDAGGTEVWQQPAENVAAFAATWCTVVDVCPYTLTAYDADGQPLATAAN